MPGPKECPSCGTLNDSSALRCDCGYPFDVLRDSKIGRGAGLVQMRYGTGFVVIGGLGLWIFGTAFLVLSLGILFGGVAVLGSGFKQWRAWRQRNRGDSNG